MAMRKLMWWFEVVHGAVFDIPVDVPAEPAEVDKAEESQVDGVDGLAVDIDVMKLI